MKPIESRTNAVPLQRIIIVPALTLVLALSCTFDSRASIAVAAQSFVGPTTPTPAARATKTPAPSARFASVCLNPHSRTFAGASRRHAGLPRRL